MSFFESLKLVRVFVDYLWVEYLWHAFIMPLTNRNGITEVIAADRSLEITWRGGCKLLGARR